MPRNYKYPGLQEKFENVLTKVLAGRESVSVREVKTMVASAGVEFGIDPEQLADIGLNFSNYATRAKDAGVLISGGPWAGYRLARASVASDHPAAPDTIRVPRQALFGVQAASLEQPKTRQHWESFLHLPLTIALSSRFSSTVLSLPTATDAVRWGNPDMLMVRANTLVQAEEDDSELDAELFQLVDATPQCVLSSIEVKGGLERDRAQMFTSISEAAANSRWANEAWLVFMDWEPSEQGLDDDVVSLARSVEVGLLEMRYEQKAGTLRTIVHHAAPIRTSLRVDDLKLSTRERSGLLRHAQKLLAGWQEGVEYFLAREGDELKALQLARQSVQNLRRQKGFTSSAASLPTLLEPLRSDPVDSDFVDGVLASAIRMLAQRTASDEDRILNQLCASAERIFPKRESECLVADFSIFSAASPADPT